MYKLEHIGDDSSPELPMESCRPWTTVTIHLPVKMPERVQVVPKESKMPENGSEMVGGFVSVKCYWTIQFYNRYILRPYGAAVHDCALDNSNLMTISTCEDLTNLEADMAEEHETVMHDGVGQHKFFIGVQFDHQTANTPRSPTNSLADA